MFRKLLGTPKDRSNDGNSTSRDAERAGETPVEDQERKSIVRIDGIDDIYSVVFLKEGKYILSGGREGRIRRWQLENGQEVGRPMDAGGWVHNMVVSKDEKWIVSGSGRGVSVWSAESHERESTMTGHTGSVYAVDISPDGIKVASGSRDKTVCIWTRNTGEQLLTLQQKNEVAAVKFSPDGSLLATANWNPDVVRVYSSGNGHLLVEFKVKVGSLFNQSLVWYQQTCLYAISLDGKIHYLDVSTRETVSVWSIRTDGAQKWSCIALPSNHRFIATVADSSIAFCDTQTLTKIRSDIYYDDKVWTMAISGEYNIAIGLGRTVFSQNLGHILPSGYLLNPVPTDPQSVDFREGNEGMVNLEKASQELKTKLATLQDSYDAQSRKLASTQDELENFKSSNEAKDHKIDALTAEVDHWKRADASKAEELAAAHKELEQRRRDSEELIAVREELHFSQSQSISVRNWYDEQFRQLKSIAQESQRTLFPVQNFVTQADGRTEMSIIETLQTVNESIQWSSTFIADRVIHNFQPRTDPTEEQLSITKRVADSIGQPLVNRLRSSSRDEIVACLPIALRAYLIYHLYAIISSWSIDSGPNRLIRELYNVVRKLESQTISGRWRSLTYASNSTTCSSNPEIFIAPTIDGLSDIIVTAGCASSTSAAKDLITSKFRGRISLILRTVGQLTKSIMDSLSADYLVQVARPSEMWDEGTMEIDPAGQGKSSRSQRVLCVTQLGLSKEVITQSGVGQNKKNIVTVTNLVKAKVLSW